MLKKSPEKNLFAIIIVAKSLMGFGWNDVGPASQTLAPTLFHNWANVSCYPGGGLSGDKVSPNSILMLTSVEYD